MAYHPPEVETAPRTDGQIRAAVFLKKPEIILIKVLAMGPITGLQKKDRDNLKVEIKHTLEAIDKGLNPMGIREARTDTGFCLFQKEEDVRIHDLLTQMWDAGYQLVGAHWQDQNKKGPVNTFEFTIGPGDREPIRLQSHARGILRGMRFNNVTIWCNLRDREGGGQFRLDTINLAKGRMTDDPSRQLVFAGNTYRLK